MSAPTSATPGALLRSIRDQLPKALPMTSISRDNDLYEAYIFSLVIKMAKVLNYTVKYEDAFGNKATRLHLRRGPGFIYPSKQSTNQDTFTHAVLSYQDEDLLELHTGVRVLGKSKVLHEADVLILPRDEAKNCRTDRRHPASSKALLVVEAKYYSNPVGLAIAREFLGLRTDISAKNLALACTIAGESPKALLAKYPNAPYDDGVFPANSGESRFAAWVERVLRIYRDLV